MPLSCKLKSGSQPAPRPPRMTTLNLTRESMTTSCCSRLSVTLKWCSQYLMDPEGQVSPAQLSWPSAPPKLRPQLSQVPTEQDPPTASKHCPAFSWPAAPGRDPDVTSSMWCTGWASSRSLSSSWPLWSWLLVFREVYLQSLPLQHLKRSEADGLLYAQLYERLLIDS